MNPPETRCNALKDAGFEVVDPEPVLAFEILGEPASKANARQLVMIKGRLVPIRSKKARDYEKAFREQCPQLDPLLEGNLAVTMLIYYKSRRPDLDESVVLDAMQGYIYKNDRQVREKHIYGDVDAENPRCYIWVTRLP